MSASLSEGESDCFGPPGGGETKKRVTDQVVKLDSCDTAVHATDDLLGDLDRINMHWVKTVTEPRDTRCDLVELDALLAAIWKVVSLEDKARVKLGAGILPLFLTNIMSELL